MLFSTLITPVFFALASSSSISDDCAVALKASYEKLASGSVSSLPIPPMCKTSTDILEGNDLTVGSAKTPSKDYCSTVINSVNIYMSSYAHDDTLNINADPLSSSEDIYGILANSSSPNGCSSGLVHMGNTTTNPSDGWDMFVESYDSMSDSCKAPDENDLLGASLWITEYFAYVEHYTAFCVVIRSIDSTWGGVVRALYSNETSFNSPADIPCQIEYEDSFNLVSCLPDN